MALAPRPPPGRGAPRGGRSSGVEDNEAALTPDAQRLIDAASAGELDWGVVEDVLGAREEGGSERPALGQAEVVEGLQIVHGVDEVEVLATFYDQDDARGLLRERQCDIPEEYKDYWSRAVDVELAGLDEASREYRAERVRALALRREDDAVTAQIVEEVEREEGRKEYRSLLGAMNALKQSMADLDTFYNAKQEELEEVQRPMDPQRRGQSHAALRRRLQERVEDSRVAEEAAEWQVEFEASVQDLGLQEYATRRTIERDTDTSLLRHRYLEIQSKECVRLAEEEGTARAALDDEIRAELDAVFTPLLEYCTARTRRQARILELQAGLS
eukprot:TRINITY_DN2036_c0_g1_i1.p1 TRINITY_DN2036_c0_g1~~TRINITY_DN2036_c0_g1_i1.p1  ORF type:complete len:330 (+),score=99.55 TRINITY_DN2036_c0_g1_i1:60-1049(+)